MWYDIVSRECDGDLIKIQEYYKIQLKAFLNHLSYKVSKTNIKR